MIAHLQSGRLVAAAILVVAAFPLAAGAAQAATSPFGVGLPEQNTNAGRLPWSAARQ